MKKYVNILLLFCFVLGMTACGGQEMAFDHAKLESLSKECMNLFVHKDYAGVENMIKASSRSKLNASTLKQAWEQTGEKMGAFLRFVSTDIETKNQNATVVLITEFENNGMTASFSFDENYEIKALYMNYQAMEEDLNLEEEDYTQQEISLTSEKPLQGAIVLPKRVSKPPVVIMVHGSGATNLNESVGAADNRPFEDIAFGLAKRGIASIRYDKRNYSYPETYEELGKNVTIQDEVLNDVSEVIDYATSLDSVDNQRIYVLGHSLGGMLAPKIAQDNPAVAGLIIMAGTARRLEDLVLDQNIMLLEQTQQSASQKQKVLSKIKEDVQAIKDLYPGSSANVYFNMPTAYWLSLNQINTEEIVKGLEIPILIQQGTADFQVYADKDYPLWQQLLGEKDTAVFHLYEGLNHLFMQNNGKKDTTEYDIKGHVEEQVIEDMATFIHQK